ncbi:MAG TPA: glutathione S-transferase family protein [Rhizomicrobium sp.]|nr:glutathione S-transferase family protein [Rhizomicrobium sp.]
MTLRLYFHPLSSFSQKVLMALYENGTPFEPEILPAGDTAAIAALKKIWPIGKFPVLRDEARDRTVPETSIIIEYLAEHYPGPVELVPKDPELARQMRLRDRFFDLHVNVPMQKIFTDRLRPAGANDAFGVEQAKEALATGYRVIDGAMAAKTWALGDRFSMADCAAAPALNYANMAVPLGEDFPHAAAYLARLKSRPSFARALKEAEAYLSLLPK